MAQTKYNCPNCRRLIDMKSVACPYCGTVNPKQSPAPHAAAAKPAPAPEVKEEFETPDDIGEELFDSVATTKHSSPAREDTEEELIMPVKAKPVSQRKEEKTAPAGNNTLSSQTVRKEKIDWEDEKENQKETRTEEKIMPNGKYNANYDGFYDDIAPKIANEVDKILANREKLVLKIIGCVAAIFATIVYFVVTLN